MCSRQAAMEDLWGLCLQQRMSEGGKRRDEMFYRGNNELNLEAVGAMTVYH